MNQLSIVPGSISEIAKQSGKSIAETFMQADIVVIVDTSGSMGSHDSTGNKSRYEVAVSELSQLQQTLPGKVAVISFSDDVQFCPSGIPINYGGSTNLTKALNFSKMADVGTVKFILISDGQPDDPDSSVSIAKTYKNHIDVIFVGPETDRQGREFMNRLAKASGGQSVTAEKAKQLGSTITYLLSSKS